MLKAKIKLKRIEHSGLIQFFNPAVPDSNPSMSGQNNAHYGITSMCTTRSEEIDQSTFISV